MSDDKRPATVRLARAFKEAGAGDHEIRQAIDGYWDDFKSPLAMPISQLVAFCRRNGMRDLSERAMAGEFDAAPDESKTWAESPEGRAAIAELMR